MSVQFDLSSELYVLNSVFYLKVHPSFVQKLLPGTPRVLEPTGGGDEVGASGVTVPKVLAASGTSTFY